MFCFVFFIYSISMLVVTTIVVIKLVTILAKRTKKKKQQQQKFLFCWRILLDWIWSDQYGILFCFVCVVDVFVCRMLFFIIIIVNYFLDVYLLFFRLIWLGWPFFIVVVVFVGNLFILALFFQPKKKQTSVYLSVGFSLLINNIQK